VSAAEERAAAAFRAWSRRHAYSLLSSIGDLTRRPLSSALTIIVLGIALSLPLGLNTALLNLERMQSQFERLDSVSVFLALDRDGEYARRQASTISAWPEVIAADPVSPEQGLARLLGATGLEGLEIADVALPWVIEVITRPGAPVDALQARLRALGGVDQVVIDLQWVRRLEAIIDLFQRLTTVLIVLFAGSVLFVISNNIRAEIEQRREEIEVMSLVGATPGYIRRPFLYTGLWMGLLGALLAWGLVRLALLALAGPIEQLAQAYGGQAGLMPPSVPIMSAMVAGSAVLGIAGAWLAVSRQLARINP